MIKYLVLIGDEDIKVTRILTDQQLKDLPESDRLDYERDRRIGERFYSGRIVESSQPYLALRDAWEIEREIFEKSIDKQT